MEYIHAVLLLHGGGKKRKKKTFAKPKKRKHKHKRVKLRVLKYYQVTDLKKTDKSQDVVATISRNRPQCAQCGPGVFMAVHKNRVHCGRCNASHAESR